MLARERGATVTGLTLSPAQAAAVPPSPGVAILVRDWLDNRLPDAAFDAAIASESLSHMPDRPRAFAELARVVRPGGRVAIVDWLSAERPGRLARRLLLDPICREGRLPGLDPASAYAAWLEQHGFEAVRFEDLTHRAARTWGVVARRLPAVLARDPRLVAAAWPERAFLPSLVRIPVAERLGAMRLGLFAARRAGQPQRGSSDSGSGAP
ncbi:MAG TPA: methyltransferase domain-containing protein [Solirubrobacteraceae bacterium]|nr:methyltransferase domain-containing protein [Solirubrobacteraceae bacterium]